MKKQNNEGFALAYVMVVIVVLCTISLALMSTTLRVLQAQQNSIERMQDKYAAQGLMEKFVAESESERTVPRDWDRNLLSGTAETEEEARKKALSKCLEWYANEPINNERNPNGPSYDCQELARDDDTYTVSFIASETCTSGDMEVSANLHFTVEPTVEIEFQQETTDDSGTVTPAYWTYEIRYVTTQRIEFRTYDIATKDGDSNA